MVSVLCWLFDGEKGKAKDVIGDVNDDDAYDEGGELHALLPDEQKHHGYKIKHHVWSRLSLMSCRFTWLVVVGCGERVKRINNRGDTRRVISNTHRPKKSSHKISLDFFSSSLPPE